MRQLFRFVLLFVCIFWVSDSFAINGLESKEYDLELVISTPLETIKEGDEIPIVFTITNMDSDLYKHDNRSGDRSGRLHEYKLTATYEDGTQIIDPRENYSGIGGSLSGGRGQLETGESFSKTIALNLWAVVKKPGVYTVKGIYSYEIDDTEAESKEGVRFMKSIKVESETIKITIEARTKEEMQQYIDGLISELNDLDIPTDAEMRKTRVEIQKAEVMMGDMPAGVSNALVKKKFSEAMLARKELMEKYNVKNLKEAEEQRKIIIKKLVYSGDPAAVSTLIDLMYNVKGRSEDFWASDFASYVPHGSEVKEKVIKAVKKRGLGNGMTSVMEAMDCSEEDFKKAITKSLESDDFDIIGEGLMAIQRHPDDDHMTKLIAIANDPDTIDEDRYFPDSNRDRAFTAIALNRTDKGVEALRALLDSPDEDISSRAAGSIRYAYSHHPIFPKEPDEDFTLKLIEALKDSNDRGFYSCLYYFMLTRTEQEVKTIRSIINDPQKKINPKKLTPAIKTIKELLDHPKEDIGDYILSFYSRPGRPLREDDFPDEFKPDIEKRKKRIIERLEE